MVRRIRLGRSPNCSSLGNVVNVLVWTQAAVAAIWVAAEGWGARRRRPEPDGGETRATDDPPALVRVGDGDGDAGPVEAHVQVTRACGLPCPACHIDPEADGEHVPVDVLATRFRDLADRGVFHVAIGGGESLRHPELPAIARVAADAGLSIGVTTSGAGPLDGVRGYAQVNVSLDGVGEAYRRARGYAGDVRALAAVRELAARGERVGVNVVLDRHTFPVLDETVAAAVGAGARDVHLLRLKPAGRAVGGYLARRLDPAQRMEVWPRLRALMDAFPDVTFRVDCAMIPWLAAHGVDPARMDAFAFHGCHGGDALLAVDTAGREHPCSFVEGPPDPRWRDGVAMEPCASCAWRAVCRGGCHAVARRLTGELLAPDPECPIVAGAA